MRRSEVPDWLRPTAAPAAEHNPIAARAFPIGSPPGSNISRYEAPETSETVTPIATVISQAMICLDMITTKSGRAGGYEILGPLGSGSVQVDPAVLVCQISKKQEPPDFVRVAGVGTTVEQHRKPDVWAERTARLGPRGE